MNEHVSIEPIPPGEYVRDELEARGWTQLDLAEILGRPAQLVTEIVTGKRSITPETAKGLAEAFGTSAQLWLNLESAYRLASVTPDKAVARRARLYVYPIRDMTKRGWIQPTNNLDVLEHQLTSFFKRASLNEIPHLDHAAKKTHYDELNTVQLAWLYRIHQLAETVTVPKYSQDKLENAVKQLRLLIHEPIETRHVAHILSESGVRFVIVEHLPQSKIDGVCLWLDKNSPVIGMSLRFDRIDNFWFVLRHEIEHVLRGHGRNNIFVMDDDLTGESASTSNSVAEEERIANQAAQEFCVPQSDLMNFIYRKRPIFSEKDVVGFARVLKIHPGLVVGQLQFKGEIPYANFKKHQVPIRKYVTGSTLSDGWGIVPNLQG
jgi:HTH-type transcriptional regulator/antitoxin HigA